MGRQGVLGLSNHFHKLLFVDNHVLVYHWSKYKPHPPQSSSAPSCIMSNVFVLKLAEGPGVARGKI